MMASWKVVVCSLYLVHLAAHGLTKKSVLSPPNIIQHPPTEVTFRKETGEKVEIPCRANGEPAPSYTWKKNDQPLTISNIDIKQLHGVGTIVINKPNSNHEGVYQCIATNNFGSALSVKTILKKAVLEPFPFPSKMLRPFVGTPLTLLCHPPFSYPKALVYWVESKGHKLRPIDSTDRISLDYEGTLYFANVLAEDSRGGVDYVCIAQNMDLRSLVQDGGVKVDPQPISGSPKHEPPRLVWPISGTNEVALRGQPKNLKCIFSGYPTPTVNWTRLDAPLPSKVIINSFGQEIRFPDIDYEDVGSYRCTGTNSHSQTSRTVTLRVESPPYWIHEKPPEDVNTSEEENARFECVTTGQPRPQIAWFINGIPVEELPPEPRRIIGRDYIDFRNVTKADAQVIQCNASNIHGYIFANAFLNVLASSSESSSSISSGPTMSSTTLSSVTGSISGMSGTNSATKFDCKVLLIVVVVVSLCLIVISNIIVALVVRKCIYRKVNASLNSAAAGNKQYQDLETTRRQLNPDGTYDELQLQPVYEEVSQRRN